MQIIDLSECEYSNRHGSYGGMDGDKDGILYNGKTLSAKRILEIGNSDLENAIRKVVPIIKEKIPAILDFIDEIPETFNNQIVCSQIRKNYYKLGLITRLEKLLIPALIAR